MQQGLLGDAPPQFAIDGDGGGNFNDRGGRGGRGGGLFSKAVGGLVLERLGIRPDDLLGAALNLPAHVIDPTIVPKKAYFYEHDDRGEDDDWGFRSTFLGRDLGIF